MDYVRDSKLDACITCWQFVSTNKRHSHFQNGHAVAVNAKIRDEVQFLKLAKEHIRYGKNE